jgi:membrane protease YdiL (CAAX protease family)
MNPLKRAAVFVALAYAVSWLLWIAAAATMGWDFSMRSGAAAIGGPLYLLGVWAPAFAAVALTAHADGRAGVSALLGRMLMGSVQVRWYLFAVGYFTAIKLAVALMQRMIAGEWPAFSPEPWFVMMAGVPLSTPMQGGEEIGWRGYLLPQLSTRVGLSVASLIVGVIWACWHLPFFFVAGADKSGQPFLPYLLGVTALSVAMAWLYWRTRGSLLLTMLMHAAVNNLNPLAASVSTSTSVLAIRASFVAWGTVALLWGCALYFLFAMRGQRRVE